MKKREYDPIAKYYDTLYPKADDIPFYTDLAQEKGAPILELGCGTGRLLLPLAKAGFQITGLDISPEMLEVAKRKIEAESVSHLVSLQLGDMCDFSLGETYNLIIIPYSNCLEPETEEEIASVLKCSFDHLNSGGYLVIDNVFIGEGTQKEWGKDKFKNVLIDKKTVPEPQNPDSLLSFVEVDMLDAKKRISRRDILVYHIGTDGSIRQKHFYITWRYVTPERMTEMLKACGFVQIDVYGGYDRKPLFHPSYKGRMRQIFLAKKS